MKSHFFIVSQLIIAAVCWNLLSPDFCRAWENYSGRTFSAYVQGIEEGNIILVSESPNDLASVFPIAFYGIGVPSESQPYGHKAREYIKSVLPAGTKIILTTVNENSTGIIYALVRLNDRSLNNQLVAEGLAWVNRSTCKAFFCRRWHIQESLAIKDRVGLWSLNISTPPWQWGEAKGEKNGRQ